jgi:ribonuclease T2
LDKRGIARAAPLFLAHGRGDEFQLQPIGRVGLATLDLDRVQLVVGHRVEALDPGGDIAIGNPLHLQLVHPAEIGDLFEAERGVVHQPDRGGLGHQRLVHLDHSFTILLKAGKTAATLIAVVSFSGKSAGYTAVSARGKVKMRLLCLVIFGLLTALPVRAQLGKAGEFDYYVLSLSWSPNWCALTGDDRGDPQCDAGRGLTFIVHGLWPQYKVGYPSDCFTTETDPSRRDTAAMADIMGGAGLGGAGLAFYQWKKHGRCTGLSAEDYFATLRRAHESLTVPPLFAGVTRDLTLPASVIQDAFLDSNPQLTADQVTVTCDSGMIEEVRICLTRDLQPRDCGLYVVEDCTLTEAGLEAVR